VVSARQVLSPTLMLNLNSTNVTLPNGVVFTMHALSDRVPSANHPAPLFVDTQQVADTETTRLAGANGGVRRCWRTTVGRHSSKANRYTPRAACAIWVRACQTEKALIPSMRHQF
jgi:hypothetical protein